MKTKKMLCIIITLVILMLFNGCVSQKIAGNEENANLKIMTSFYPIYVATINVTKDIEGVTVTNMTKSQIGCLHNYQLTSEDMKKLAESDFFIVNGAGMESFLEKAMNQQKNLKIIEASEGIPLIKGHGGENPHVWLSISNEIEQVKNIASQLSIFDKKNADKYKRNADAYIKQLLALQKETKESFQSLKSRDIITFHEAFSYFANEFDLNVIDVIEREPGTEPTPKELEDTITKVKGMPVRVIFTEPQYPVGIAEVIAREANAKIYLIDPCVTGEANENAVNSYINTMTKNIETIKKALNN